MHAHMVKISYSQITGCLAIAAESSKLEENAKRLHASIDFRQGTGF